jgi:hypothetical protein
MQVMSRMQGDILLVGSVPLETSEEVFRAAAGAIGEHLSSLPDGETGERTRWIVYLAYRTFHGHPQIETVNRPASIDGVEQWTPKTMRDGWRFKVKKAVDRVKFGDPGWRLGYTHEAVNSYAVFRALRELGVIPNRVKFQVCLPTTGSALTHFFPEPEDFALMATAYEDALRAEIGMLVTKIPPTDLVIQWDFANEIVDLGTAEPTDEWLQAVTGPFYRLSSQIPGDVALGYHFCYGTFPKWPMVPPKNLELCVALTNIAVAQSGRRVDFVHMPVPHDRFDDAYYSPLRGLKAKDVKIYLGLIHQPGDGVKERIAVAKRYLPQFGISAVCGFGRLSRDQVAALLNEHRRAADLLGQMQ